MTTIKVSEKFQVVIPKDVRTAAHIKPKQELLVWAEGGRIQMAPLRRIANPTLAAARLAKENKIRLTAEQIERIAESELEEENAGLPGR